MLIATGADGSTSTPAARSLSSAFWVAVISSGDSHSLVATATAAASSGVRSMSGREYLSGLIRYPSTASKERTRPVSSGMPRSRNSFLSRSNIRENASSLAQSP